MAPNLLTVLLCVLSLTFMDKVQSCKLDCKVQEWSGWTAFSTCDDRQATCYREREILRRPEKYGRGCGDVIQLENCILCPINCRWGAWSKWSNCTACGSGGRSRYRTVAQPAVFGGQSCGPMSVQIDGTCEAENSCETTRCDPADFTCTNGKCIPSHLKCNRDNDCDDNSDEIDCVEIDNICLIAPPIPGLLNAGQGYDVLSDQFKSGVLDNEKYFGTCKTVHDHSSGNTYRKPWNILDYNDRVHSGQELLVDGYSSPQDYRRELKKKADESLSVWGAVAGILASISSSVSYSTSAETQNIVQTSVSESSSYFKVEREIGIATFSTRHKDLILTKSFSDDINELPAHLDYQKYTDIFKKYGTHYVSSGKLGGKIDHVLRYYNNKIKLSDITMSERLDCIGAQLSARILNVITDTTDRRCDTNSDSEHRESSFWSFASEIRTLVTGGSSAATSVLSYFTVDATKDDYRAWADSISQKPDLLSYKLKPITELLPVEKRENGVAALTAFLGVYNPIHCKTTCQNNGELVVIKEGRECLCICPYPYYGISCGREVDVIADDSKKPTAPPPKILRKKWNGVKVNHG